MLNLLDGVRRGGYRATVALTPHKATNLNISFHQWLLLKRREHGLTQGQIANALDVSKQTVSNWENGRSTPSLTIGQIKTLCQILRCSLSEIPAEREELQGHERGIG
jgi:DNA-binding XRE family transcriptional regulator